MRGECVILISGRRYRSYINLKLKPEVVVLKTSKIISRPTHQSRISVVNKMKPFVAV